jgi:hypothetical protein
VAAAQPAQSSSEPVAPQIYFIYLVFSRVELSALRPTPGYSGGPMCSVRVVFLSRLVPILKRQDPAFRPCMT